MTTEFSLQQGSESPAPAPPRERILTAAYRLFSAKGIDGAGVEEVMAAAGVAKATFYRHFRSKEELALAYLQRWYETRSAGIAAAAVQLGHRDEAALERVLSEIIGQWILDPGAEVGSFRHFLLTGRGDSLGKAVAGHLSGIRDQIAGLARTAGLRDPEGFASSWLMIVKGALVTTMEGYGQAHDQARRMAAVLIHAHHSPA